MTQKQSYRVRKKMKKSKFGHKQLQKGQILKNEKKDR